MAAREKLIVNEDNDKKRHIYKEVGKMIFEM